MSRTRYLALAGLSLALAGAACAAPAGGAMADADTNGDGLVSQTEFVAARQANFVRLDQNGDGYLDSADKPSGMAGRRGGRMVEAAMQRFDANGDGRVSKAEFSPEPPPMFAMADKNKDGSLDAAEMDAVRDQMRGMMQKSRS